MKKFRFKLATPLKVKQMMEDIKKLELAETIAVKHREEERLRCIESSKLRMQQQMLSHLAKSARVFEVKNYHGFLYKVNIDVEYQRKQVQRAREAYDATLRSYMITKTERQTLDKLREKQYSRYMEEVNKEEQKQSDESAMNSFVRQEVEGDHVR